MKGKEILGGRAGGVPLMTLEYLLKNIFIWYVPVSIILVYITQLSLRHYCHLQLL